MKGKLWIFSWGILMGSISTIGCGKNKIYCETDPEEKGYKIYNLDLGWVNQDKESMLYLSKWMKLLPAEPIKMLNLFVDGRYWNQWDSSDICTVLASIPKSVTKLKLLGGDNFHFLNLCTTLASIPKWVKELDLSDNKLASYMYEDEKGGVHTLGEALSSIPKWVYALDLSNNRLEWSTDVLDAVLRSIPDSVTELKLSMPDFYAYTALKRLSEKEVRILWLRNSEHLPTDDPSLYYTLTGNLENLQDTKVHTVVLDKESEGKKWDMGSMEQIAKEFLLGVAFSNCIKHNNTAGRVLSLSDICRKEILTKIKDTQEVDTLSLPEKEKEKLKRGIQFRTCNEDFYLRDVIGEEGDLTPVMVEKGVYKWNIWNVDATKRSTLKLDEWTHAFSLGPIKKLDLSMRNLYDWSVPEIAALWRSIPDSVEILNLSYNELDHYWRSDSDNLLGIALASLTSVRNLDLSDNDLEWSSNTLGTVFSSIPKSTTTLTLSMPNLYASTALKQLSGKDVRVLELRHSTQLPTDEPALYHALKANLWNLQGTKVHTVVLDKKWEERKWDSESMKQIAEEFLLGIALPNYVACNAENMYAPADRYRLKILAKRIKDSKELDKLIRSAKEKEILQTIGICFR